MLYALALVLVIAAMSIIGVIVLSRLGGPQSSALAIAGIATAAVVALFQFWPF